MNAHKNCGVTVIYLYVANIKAKKVKGIWPLPAEYKEKAHPLPGGLLDTG